MIDNLTDAIRYFRQKARNIFLGETFDNYGKLADWLTELQERREADRWIPVSERLPETTNLILLSVRHETPTRTHTAVYGGYYDGKFLTVNSVAVEGCFVEGCNTKVIAWRSLPEPYKESEGA